MILSAGNIFESIATFTNTDTGANVDPTTVVVKYDITNTTTSGVTTITYSGATTPAPGVIAKTAVGVYELQIDTTALPGFYQYEWISTGTGQASIPSSFTVTALPI